MRTAVRGVVAGDHDHADAGAVRFADRGGGFGAGRVDDAHGADEDEVALQHVGGLGGLRQVHRLVRPERAVRHGQRAQRGVRQRADVAQDALAPGVVQRDGFQPDAGAAAASKQHIRRALADQHPFVAVVVVALDGGHHLAVGREGQFGDALEAGDALFMRAQLALGDEEGGFGRIALDLPGAVRGLAQVGVAGEAAAGEQGDVFVAQRAVGEFGALVLDAAVGRVADAGDLRAARGGHHAHDGHLGAGQRAGLVRGDHRG